MASRWLEKQGDNDSSLRACQGLNLALELQPLFKRMPGVAGAVIGVGAEAERENDESVELQLGCFS